MTDKRTRSKLNALG